MGYVVQIVLQSIKSLPRTGFFGDVRGRDGSFGTLPVSCDYRDRLVDLATKGEIFWLFEIASFGVAEGAAIQNGIISHALSTLKIGGCLPRSPGTAAVMVHRSTIR